MIKKKEIKEYIIKYSARSPYFEYGVDELLNILNLSDFDHLNLPLKYILLLEKINIKRYRFLKSALASPNLKPFQVNAITKSIELMEDDGINKKAEQKTIIEFI